MKRELIVFVVSLLFWAVMFCCTGCASAPTHMMSTSLPQEQAERLARQVAGEIGGKYWTITGVSMQPNLIAGTVIVTEAATFDELRSGDVVVYRTARLRTIVHRLQRQKAAGWVVCGDANAVADDELVTRSNFLGRQCAVFFTQ